MGKSISPIFKFQGTIGDLVFVNSKAYKKHVRSKKNSKTPFVWTANFAENNQRLHACNDFGSLIFQALRLESHDGMLWSRMVKSLFAGLKAGEPLSLQKFKDLECNLTHPMHEVIAGAYDFSATREQNEVRIRVLLEKHPVTDDKMPRTGYQLRMVAISRNPATGNVTKRDALGPLTQYNSELEAVNLTIPLPSPDVSCMLVMGIVPHMRNEGPVRIMSDSGMKVLWVDEVVMPEVVPQRPEIVSKKPEAENQLSVDGSVKLNVGDPQTEAGCLRPGTPIQASMGNTGYWQHSTAMGFVRFVPTKSS
ncbi:MAG: hypothetical protein J7527_09115 [Chitinophagaceae bacterium]|nr:hypothetical protein [Chitinophagaceae bacterium]